MALPRPKKPRLSHFVAGEVCMVLSAAPVSGDAPRALYEKVRQVLNERIVEHLKTRQFGSRDKFKQDLAPRTLVKYADEFATRPPLQPLDLGQPAPGQHVFTPWVVLGSQEGEAPEPAASLYFYSIGVPEEARYAAVRDVVNLVNSEFLGPLGDERGPRIVAATPNWLAAGSPSDFTGGGPGARPEPAPGGFTWKFRFADSQLQALAATPPADNVVVAVLDTCPEPAAVEAAVTRWGDRNPLLTDVFKNVRLADPPSLPADYFTRRVGQHVVNWDKLLDQPRPDEHFLMPDHGLFVAGIIRDIAPNAEVRLIRVLGDYGVGDVFGLVSVLRRLQDVIEHDRPGAKVIVNMSLVVDVPSSDQLLDLWYARSAKDLSTIKERWTDICASFSLLHRNVAEAIGWLRRQDVLLVAAAGNDNLLARRSHGQGAVPTRPEPRVPARYDEVLGVGAVRANRTSAEYSNRGDVVVIGNGVAIFGGNAELDPKDPNKPPVINTQPGGRPVDAVAGIYSTPDFPLSDPPRNVNQSGWAYWAGTSFAAPIVSAIAANYWPTAGTNDPGQVIDDVIRLFRDPTVPTDLDCPTIIAEQVRTAAPP